jgi:hypothetical protein
MVHLFARFKKKGTPKNLDSQKTFGFGDRDPTVPACLTSEKRDSLCSLDQKRFRSFDMNDVPAALWPHALAKVNQYPSLSLLLFRQIPGSLDLVKTDF